MPEETEGQKFRKAALAELEQIRGIVTEARTILQELKAEAAKAKGKPDDDED